MIWVAWPPASTTTFSPAIISLAFQPPHFSHVVHYSYLYLNTTQSFQAFTTTTTRTFSHVSDLPGLLPPYTPPFTTTLSTITTSATTVTY